MRRGGHWHRAVGKIWGAVRSGGRSTGHGTGVRRQEREAWAAGHAPSGKLGSCPGISSDDEGTCASAPPGVCQEERVLRGLGARVRRRRCRPSEHVRVAEGPAGGVGRGPRSRLQVHLQRVVLHLQHLDAAPRGVQLRPQRRGLGLPRAAVLQPRVLDGHGAFEQRILAPRLLQLRPEPRGGAGPVL